MLLTQMRIINWSIKVLENPDRTKDLDPRKVEEALWKLRIAQDKARIKVAKICFPDANEEETNRDPGTPPSMHQGAFAHEGELYLSGYFNN